MKKSPKPRKRPRLGKGKKSQPKEGLLRRTLALLLLLGVVAVVVWLGRKSLPPAANDQQKLERIVRKVLARFSTEETSLNWEHSEGSPPTLVLVLHAPEGFPGQQFAWDLEAALHNLGGQLEPLPVLEKGGYGRAAFRGRLGKAGLRVLILGARTEKPQEPVAKKNLPKPPTVGKLSVVLDDAGYSLDVLPLLAHLPKAVAVAVLPNAPKSAEVAEALRIQGREVLLHMPMEPQGNGPSPGEGAITLGLSREEVRQHLEAALAVVGPVSGVNNHMGSRATADGETMKAFMSALAGRGLYFLDSRTTAASVAAVTAERDGIATLRRDVFLDVVAEEGSVRSALATAAALARAGGSAVAIGHVHPVTLRVLAAQLPTLQGVELVRPSQLLGETPR